MKSSDELKRRPLRVGLLVDSLTLPSWVSKVLEDIQSSSIAELALVIKNRSVEAGGSQKRNRLDRIWRNRQRLLYAAYTKLDELTSKVDPDPFKSVNATHLLSACPTLEVEPLMKGHVDRLKDEDVETIRSYALDVILRFGFRILKGSVLRSARWGVWSYHHGDSQVNRGGPPGFWEVMNADPVTGSVLQILTEELDNGRIIYRSWAPTLSNVSVKTNKKNYYWKSSAFVMRKLKELYESDGTGLDHECTNGLYRPYFKPLYKTPTNSEMVPLLLALVKRVAAKKIQWPHLDQWCLAYRRTAESAEANNNFYGFTYLIPPRDRFWADPFPIKYRGELFIFLEECLYKDGKGFISATKMDSDGKFGKPFPVLEKDYHLSYPFIFEWRGEYYMIPETCANKRIELYKCVSFPDAWQLETILMENVTAADATLAEIEGTWWMFVNMPVDGMTRNWDELHLFYADNPMGPWKPHRKNPIKSDVRSARPAGRLFQWNGSYYRPAQDCSNGYGYAITLNRIVSLNENEFLEEEIQKILPQWDKHLVGTHTLNRYDNLTVIDCLMRRRAFSGSGSRESSRPWA